MIRKLCSYAIFGFIASLSSVMAIEDSEELWAEYRKTAPFLSQDLIVVDTLEDKTVLLFTEPPASFARRHTKLGVEIFGPSLLKSEVKLHKVGFDGWSKDIIFVAKKLSVEQLDSVIRQIHMAAFGTDYKASYRRYTPKPWRKQLAHHVSKGVPSIQITQATLNDWLFENPIPFDSEKMSGAALMRQLLSEARGILYSSKPGLVLLVIDTRVPLNNAKAQLRAFTLDIDLLIGAAKTIVDGGGERLVLIGRERELGLDQSPPLRLDVIYSLAASSTTDLAQSYERRMPFAGRIEKRAFEQSIMSASVDQADRAFKTLFGLGGVDWAPILLSRELTHTQYGQLLNITDQMLKSWSLLGDIEYGNFPYEKPKDYPAQSGVMNWLGEQVGEPVRTLTFNWNTSGFGAWVRFGSADIFGFNRTGALPVSYLPDSGSDFAKANVAKALRTAEENYWKFFSELANPELTLVSQYTGLHQIFQKAPIRATRTAPIVSHKDYDARWARYGEVIKASIDLLASDAAGAPPDEKTGCLLVPSVSESLQTPEVESALAILKRYRGSKRTQLVGAISDRIYFRNEITRELDGIEARRSSMVSDYNTGVTEARQLVDRCNDPETRFDSAAFLQCRNKLKALEERLESQGSQIDDLESRYKRIGAVYGDMVADLGRLQGNFPFLSLVKSFGSCVRAADAVVADIPKLDAAVYKTPSVVISLSTESWTSVGGHNLDGRSARVLTDKNLKTGEFRLSEDGNIIYVAPENIGKAPQIARAYERQWRKYKFGRSTERTRIRNEMTAALKGPAPEILPFGNSALRRSDAAAAGARGFGAHSQQNRFVTGSRTELLNKEQAKEWNVFAERTGSDIVVEAKDGKFYVFNTKNPPPPALVVSGNQIGFQRSVNNQIQILAQNRSAGSRISVTPRAGISQYDLQNLQISRQASEILAGAGGGSGGIPPRNTFAFLFPEGGNGGGIGRGSGSGKTPRNPIVRIAGDFKSAKSVLGNTNASWSGAKVNEFKITHMGSEGQASTQILFKLEIPVVSEPSIFGRMRALFKKRQADANDIALIKSSFEENFLKAAQESSKPEVGSVLLKAIEDLKRALDGEASVRGALNQGIMNFDIVRRSSDGSGDDNG